MNPVARRRCAKRYSVAVTNRSRPLTLSNLRSSPCSAVWAVRSLIRHRGHRCIPHCDNSVQSATDSGDSWMCSSSCARVRTRSAAETTMFGCWPIAVCTVAAPAAHSVGHASNLVVLSIVVLNAVGSGGAPETPESAARLHVAARAHSQRVANVVGLSDRHSWSCHV